MAEGGTISAPGAGGDQPDAGAARHTVSSAASPLDSSNSPALVRFFWAALAVALLLAAPWAYRVSANAPFNPDPFIYGETVKQILAGERLYSSIPFDKGPLVAVFYAIPQLLAPRSYWAMGFFAGILISLQALMVWRVFRGCAAACLAAMVFIIVCPLGNWDFQWLSTEHISNLFVMGNLLLGYVIFRDGRASPLRCVAAGVVTCLAYNTRQTTLLFGAVPALAIVMNASPAKEKIIGLGWAVLGGVATLLPILALVARIGDLRGYAHAMLGGASQYASIGTWGDSWRLLKILINGPCPAPLFLFFGMTLMGRYRWLALTAAIIGLLVIVLPRREYEHYLVSFFPVIALMIAIAIDRVTLQARSLGWIGVALVAALVFPAAIPQLQVASGDPMTWQCREIAAEIDRAAPPGAKLMVIGRLTWAEAVMYMSRLPPVNDFWVTWELDPPVSELLPESVDQIEDDYLANPPGVIAVEAAYMQRGERRMQLVEPKGTHQHNAVWIAATLLQRPGAYALHIPGPNARYWIWTLRPPEVQSPPDQ